MFYRIFRAFITRCLRVYYRRIEAPGLEGVPRTGPLLLVANHGNALLDPLLLLALLPRPLSFLAKHTLFDTPVIGYFTRRIGVFPSTGGRMRPARPIGTRRPWRSAGGFLRGAAPSVSSRKA